MDEVGGRPVVVNQQHLWREPPGQSDATNHGRSLRVRLRLHHLVEDVAGEKVVLHVGDLHGHRDAVVVGPLLWQRGGKERKFRGNRSEVDEKDVGRRSPQGEERPRTALSWTPRLDCRGNMDLVGGVKDNT